MWDGRTKSAGDLFTRVDLEKVLHTDNFTVNDACISCGHCAKICPAYAIEMDDEGHPTWVKHDCFMCFGCLRLCPVAAIRYGDQEPNAAGTNADEQPVC